MSARRPTRVPVAPALVRRRVGALTLGLGLGGALACGGEVQGQTGADRDATPGDGSPDAPAADAAGSVDARADEPITFSGDAGTPRDAAPDAVADVAIDRRWIAPCGIPPPPPH